MSQETKPKKIEKRLFPINAERRQLNEGVEAKVLKGMPIVYEERSQNFGTDTYPFYEIVKKGAATEALKKSDARALYDHGNNGTLPLGRESAGTLELRETEKGVESLIYLPDTSFASDLWKSVERGDLREMSFAFYVEKDSYEVADKVDYRYVEKLKELLDVSVVTYAAYPDTSVALSKRNAIHAERETETRKQKEDEIKLIDIYLFEMEI